MNPNLKSLLSNARIVNDTVRTKLEAQVAVCQQVLDTLEKKGYQVKPSGHEYSTTFYVSKDGGKEEYASVSFRAGSNHKWSSFDDQIICTVQCGAWNNNFRRMTYSEPQKADGIVARVEKAIEAHQDFNVEEVQKKLNQEAARNKQKSAEAFLKSAEAGPWVRYEDGSYKLSKSMNKDQIEQLIPVLKQLGII